MPPNPQSSNFAKFLIRLSEQPAVMKSFKSNPIATMKKAGLSEQEQRIVLTKDAVKMKSAILKNRYLLRRTTDDNTVTVVVVVVVV